MARLLSWRTASVRLAFRRESEGYSAREVSRRSAPTPEADEGCPVVGTRLLAPAIDLRVPERLRRRLVALEDMAVEGREELGSGAVVDLPETHREARRAGVQKCLEQADQPLAADLLAQACLTARKDSPSRLRKKRARRARS
jgi:hypothetical protein